jgi:hypothetical protein
MRPGALGTLLLAATLLQGCSALIAWRIENQPRQPPDIAQGTSREQVEARLGQPQEIAQGADGSVLATYEYRLHPPNWYGKPDRVIEFFLKTGGLFEILTFPVGLLAIASDYARSTVHRIDVTYGPDRSVAPTATASQPVTARVNEADTAGGLVEEPPSNPSVCENPFAHSNGLGQQYRHCHALGTPGNAATYNQTMATAARAAWLLEGIDSTAVCNSPPAEVVVRDTGSQCAVWAYSGLLAGFVKLASTCQCPTTTAFPWY